VGNHRRDGGYDENQSFITFFSLLSVESAQLQIKLATSAVMQHVGCAVHIHFIKGRLHARNNSWDSPVLMASTPEGRRFSLSQQDEAIRIFG
jgi:hypothetical protein